jgi:hypothetical protein
VADLEQRPDESRQPARRGPTIADKGRVLMLRPPGAPQHRKVYHCDRGMQLGATDF